MGRPEVSLLLITLTLAAGPLWAGIPTEVKQALATRDFATAAQWLDAHRDDPDAAFELGKLYRLGKGVARDEDKAVALFQTAGSAGNVEAQYLLGKLYDRAGDPGQAQYWMSRAAQSGHASAANWLASHATAAAGTDLFTLIRTDRRPPDTAPTTDLAAVDEAGRTPLLLAAGSGSLAWTEYLLRYGAKPDDRDRLGATALHLALAGRFPEVAAALLDAGADPALTTREGNTALHLAVTGGETALARRMLSMGADADVENAAGWTPRQLAKRSDDAALHGLFGVKSAERNALASAKGHEDALRLAQQAARRGDGKTLRRLLDGDGSARIDVNALRPVLFEAATNGNADVLEVVIGVGIGLDGRDGQQRTALMLAAQSGCVTCVDILVRNGGGLEARDPQGRTAFILAAREGRLDVVEALAGAGEVLVQADDLGRNALWWACRADHAAVAMRLLGLGVPIRSDSEGTGPLHLAAGNDDGPLISALVGRVDIDEPVGDGSRPLMMAARAGAVRATTVLLDAGADVRARNTAGDTALIVAVRAGQLPVAELLMKAGANPNTRNDRFESAASLMAERQEPGWDALLKASDKGLLGLFGALSN